MKGKGDREGMDGEEGKGQRGEGGGLGERLNKKGVTQTQYK